MINIRNRKEKINFSNAALLSCLAEDLVYENKCLMEIISDYNQIIEVELGIDMETAYPDLWAKIGQMAITVCKRKEEAVYELY